MQRPKNNKKATVWLAAGVIIIALPIMGLLFGWDPNFDSQTGLNSSINEDTAWRLGPSISKNTLLVLLAVGITGALGLIRKNKDNGQSSRENLKE